MQSPFYVLILGSGSAIPKKDKNHSAQLVVYNQKYFLLDCGEGTQIQCKKFGVNIQKIEAIFITHLHGDHYLGLPGLISTMNLLGREKKLSVYGPPQIKEVIDLHFKLANARSQFPIDYFFTQTDSKSLVYDSDQIRVFSFPLIHKIPTTGFLFEGGSLKRKMVPALLDKYNVPKSLRSGIRDGKDFISTDGSIIQNKALTNDPPRPRKYAYCTDTGYIEDVHTSFSNAELIYHEATFTEADKQIAKTHFHSTGKQAASIAKNGNVKKLLIGHISNKYNGDSLVLNEAKEVFTNTEIAIEGNRYEIE